MNVVVTGFSLALLAASIAMAQVPGPPAAISKFDVLLGNWEGSGVWRPTAERPEAEWTAVSTVSKIMNDHFVQEDLRIEFGAPGPLIYRTIYAWDRYTERFVYAAVSNMGAVDYGEVYWTQEGKLVAASVGAEEGVPVMEQAVYEFSKDRYKFQGRRSGGGEPFFVQIEGSFQRGGAPFSASEGTEPLSMAPPAAEMAKVEKHVGSWSFTGKVSPMPGFPLVPISGREKIRRILGGHINMATVEGDAAPGAPMAYRGVFYIAWHPENRCFLSVTVDNYGHFGLARGYPLGRHKMVYTSAPVLFGMPQTTRTTEEWNGADEVRFVTDRCVGDAPPGRSFELLRKRVEKQKTVTADWAQFRGPESSGKSPAKNLPVTWAFDKNVVWKQSLPGFGASSPIVVGDKVFVTCYTGYGLDAKEPGEQKGLRLQVVCCELSTGNTLWKKELAAKVPEEDYQRFLPEHGYASGTPASDGEAIYTFFGKSGVHAFDLNGKHLWEASAGTNTHVFGTASSPLLYENLVIINACVESDAIVAFDKKNGQEVWRTEGISRAWSSPVLVQVPGGGQEVVVSTDGAVLGFDPATGEKLWWCDGIDDYICPSVVAHEGIAYAVGGRKSVKAVAVRVGGRGDVTATHRLWKSGEGSKVPSPVYHEGHLYWVQDTGIAFCMNATTGEIVYKQRLEGIGQRSKTYASAVFAEGRLYIVTCESGTFVLEAKPEFRQLGHSFLGDKSIFNASPAVTDGRLILRSDRFLYCLGKSPQADG